MANDNKDKLDNNVVDDEKLEDAVGGSSGKGSRLITATPKHVCSNGLDLGRIGKWFGRYGSLVPATSLGPNGEQLFKCSNCGMVGYVEFCANRKYCFLRPCKGTSGPVKL